MTPEQFGELEEARSRVLEQALKGEYGSVRGHGNDGSNIFESNQDGTFGSYKLTTEEMKEQSRVLLDPREHG